jgi:hypothetical protein
LLDGGFSPSEKLNASSRIGKSKPMRSMLGMGSWLTADAVTSPSYISKDTPEEGITARVKGRQQIT